MRTTALRTSLSAAAALLLVIGGAACTNDDPTSTPTLEPAPTGEASDGGGEPQQTPSEDATAGECQVRSGDEALPNEAPEVDAWEDISGTPVPTSETYGPHVRAGTDDALWSCYQHSATGALFATFYVYAAMGNVEGVVDAWVADSDVKQQLLTAAETSDGETQAGSVTPTAYRFVSYSPEKAVVDAVMEYGDESGTGYVSMRFPLVWEDDGWKIDGEQYIENRPTPLESLDGYVRWRQNV